MQVFKNIAKINLLLLFLAGLTYCDSEDEVVIDNPTVSLSGEDFDQLSFEPGENIDLTITYTAPQGLAGVNYEFIRISDGERLGNKIFLNPDIDIPDASSDDVSGTIDFDAEVPGGAPIGENINLIVEIVDQTSAIEATSTFTFSVESPLNSFQTILLQAPTDNKASESFFSTNTGERYTVQEVNQGAAGLSENIDFGYYYGDNNNASLAAPSTYPAGVYDLGAENWNQLNSTTFVTTSITQSEFNETTTLVQIEDAYTDGTDPNDQKVNLSVGDVLAFETDASKENGSKKGLILISAIDPGNESDKSITLEIIIEE